MSNDTRSSPAAPHALVRRALLRAIGRGLAARPTRRSERCDGLRRILLIRPDHLGDVLWLTAGLRGLRARYPEVEVTVAVGPWSTPALANNPDLDALLPLPFPGFVRESAARGGKLSPYALLARAARQVRALAFDAAVILRDDHWWGALLAASAGVPRRFGYAHPDVAPFLTDALPLAPGRHAARNNIALLDALLAAGGRETISGPAGVEALSPLAWPVRFRPTPAEMGNAAALLATHPAPRGPLVAIQPGAGVPVKLWDEARWARVADRLAADYGARIVLTGGPGDEWLTAAIAAQMTAQTLDLAGRTTFGESAAVLERCALALGPDGGGLHLAVAAGTPTVHLYGPADPALYGPWGAPARHRVVRAGLRCADCGNLSTTRPRGAACMLAIGVDEVLAAATALLAGHPTAERVR